MSADATAALALRGVSCTFVSKDDPGQRYTAVRDVDLSVGAGEFVSVVGPTGCGKSTLLNVPKDFFGQFDKKNMMEATVAKQYRDTVLSRGGSRPAMELVREFLGREFTYDAWKSWLEQ